MSVYAALFRYRDLFGNLVRRDVQVRYKGSLLGVAWSLANPSPTLHERFERPDGQRVLRRAGQMCGVDDQIGRAHV